MPTEETTTDIRKRQEAAMRDLGARWFARKSALMGRRRKINPANVALNEEIDREIAQCRHEEAQERLHLLIENLSELEVAAEDGLYVSHEDTDSIADSIKHYERLVKDTARVLEGDE